MSKYDFLPFLYDRVPGLQEVLYEFYLALPNLYDGVGLIGVGLYMVAYMGVQVGQIDGNRLGYTLLNGMAAGCILFSMLGAFNLASALVNGMFMLFSLIGAIRILSRAGGLRA